MSDCDDQSTETRANKDDQSAACSKIRINRTQSLQNTQFTDLNQRMDKAAERSRMYRERHKEDINQRRRETRQQNVQITHTVSNIHNTDKIEQAISNNKKSSNSQTERYKRYYEKHKEELNKRKRDKRRKQQKISKPNPIPPAVRNRNYRERNKHEINKRRRETRRQKKLQQTDDSKMEICYTSSDGLSTDTRQEETTNTDNYDIQIKVEIENITETDNQFDKIEIKHEHDSLGKETKRIEIPETTLDGQINKFPVRNVKLNDSVVTVKKEIKNEVDDDYSSFDDSEVVAMTCVEVCLSEEVPIKAESDFQDYIKEE